MRGGCPLGVELNYPYLRAVIRALRLFEDAHLLLGLTSALIATSAFRQLHVHVDICVLSSLPTTPDRWEHKDKEEPDGNDRNDNAHDKPHA